MKKMLLLFVLTVSSSSVMARMYQWVDPDSGTTQLSGKPPSWYRSEEKGPRVIVYDNGRIVDDTGIKLTNAENEKLRQEALISVETDRTAALEKLQQARQQKATLDFQGQENEPIEIVPEPAAATEQTDASTDNKDAGPTAEELRELIDKYEKMKTEDARQLIETAAPTGTTAPAEPVRK